MMRKLFYAAALVALGSALAYSWYFSYDYVHVDIDKGTLRGFNSTTWRGTEYFTFKGIPYAKPPLGELRFKGPQEETAWAGVRNAVSHGDVCPHLDIATGFLRGQEDCLFLNVYTPTLGAERLPVMVWIHGGGFVMGSANDEIYGADYFMEAGVVLVTLNYRLGALGFLYTEDDGAPGNAGLKDQVAALKWVRRNIAKFGGDPENVTLFGESAGGASTHYHLLSPMSAGLFAKAIGQSGSALNIWSLSENGAAVTIRLAEALGAKNIAGDTAKALEFLKVAPYEDIVKIQGTLRTAAPLRGDHRLVLIDQDELERGGQSFPLAKSVIHVSTILGHTLTPPKLILIEKGVKSEEVFLPDSPLKLLESGNFNKVPYITGYTSHEGYLFLRELTKPEIMKGAIDDTERFIPREIENEQLRNELAKSIRQFYFDDKPIATENMSNLVNLYTDTTFTAGIHRATKLQLQSTDTPVYIYVFSYDGGLNLLKYFFNINHPGAAHGDELGYLFNHKILFWKSPTIGSDDEHVLNTMIRLWTNFAKYGNPTPAGDPLTWKPVTIDKFNFLNISGRDTKLDENPDFERAKFWANAYEKDAALRH